MISTAPFSSDRRNFILVALLVGIAFAVRLPNLAERELWVDEANGVLIALKGFSGIIGALKQDGNPPGYYFLLSMWSGLFGISEVAVRSLSILIGVSLIPLVYLLGRSWFSRQAGLFAAFFVAISPFHVYYSREARMYSLMTLLAACALLASDRLVKRRTILSVLMSGLALAACLYTHNYGLFLLPAAPLASLFVRKKRGQAFLMASSASVFALLLASPWLPVVLRQSQTGVGDWIPELFFQETDGCSFSELGPPGRWVVGLSRSVTVMSPGANYPYYLRKMPTEGSAGPLPLILLTVMFASAFILSRTTTRDRRTHEEENGEEGARVRERVWLLSFSLLVPMGLPLLYSVAVKPIYLIGRYEVLVFPFAALLFSQGADRLLLLFLTRAWRRTWSLALVGIVGWLSFSSLRPYLFGENPIPPHARVVAKQIQERGKEGDWILFTEVTRATTEYALRRLGCEGKFRIASFPEAAGLHPGWYDPKEFAKSLPMINQEAMALSKDIYSQLRQKGQLWLLNEGRYPDLHQVLYWNLRALFGDYRPGRSKPVRGLYCYVKKE